MTLIKPASSQSSQLLQLGKLRDARAGGAIATCPAFLMPTA
jgi:hypothetical protein